MLHLIDGNNVFRRVAETDITGQPLRTFLLFLQNLRSSVAVPIVVWDPPNALSRRRAVVPYYKQKRQAMPENISAAQKLMKEILAHTEFIQCEVPTYEADDVIAELSRDLKDVTIHSTDQDFAALGRTMVPEPSLKVPPCLIAVYKASVGDPSDCLKGIKGFGKKAWDGVNQNDLHRLIKGDWNTPDGMPESCMKWLSVPENYQQVRNEYEVIQFLKVPTAALNRGTIIGNQNPTVVEALLRKFLQ